MWTLIGFRSANLDAGLNGSTGLFDNGYFVDRPVSGTPSDLLGGNLSAGKVIGVALDIDANTYQFFVDNSSVKTGTLSATAGIGVFPLFYSADSSYAQYIINFGQTAFVYTPPTGFKALSTGNLPEPTIKKGDKYFDTKLYTGTGGSQSLSGLGFQPDLVWIKARSTASSHGLYDAVRGVGQVLLSNSTSAEQNYGSYGVTSFNSAGFSVNDLPGYGVNDSGQTYAAWCWDANGAGSSNTAGSITSTVSANATAGFSIATYTGNGTAGATVGHGLGVTPKMIIVKQRSGATDWQIGHTEIGWTKTLYFNTSAATTETGAWNNTAPTSTVFSIGTSRANTSSATYVAYCFSEVASFSKFGIYTGNGSTDGPFVACNFRPAWIMLKVSSTDNSWFIYDVKRNTYNAANKTFKANGSDEENTGSSIPIDILSNGFKLRSLDGGINGSGSTYIFAAFAELPAKYSNAR